MATRTSRSSRNRSCARRCRACCNQFIRLWLLALNIIDGVAGVGLLAWGGYLWAELGPTKTSAHDDAGHEGSEGYYACVSALALGAALAFAALLSFAGAAFRPCRCGLCLSAWLSAPIAVGELCAAVTALVKSDAFFDWLRRHRDQLRLSAYQVDLLEEEEKVVIAALFALCAAECARAVLSTTLRRHINLNIAEYDALLREAEESDARSDLEARLLVKEKYDYMREKYRAKYARDDDLDADTEAGPSWATEMT